MRLSIAITFLAFSFSLFAQKNIDEYQGMGGFIASISETSFKQNESLVSGKVINQITFINDRPIRKDSKGENGEIESQRFYTYEGRNLVKIQDVLIDGTLKRVTDYKYNENGKLVFEQRYVPQFEITTTEATSYNEAGKVSKSIFSNNGETVDEVRFEYNPNHVVMIKRYDTKGKLKSIKTIQYDDYEMLILSEDVKFTGENSFLNMKSIFEYDERGNLIKTTIGNLVEIREYEYDKWGNWIKMITYDQDKALTQSIVERDIIYSK